MDDLCWRDADAEYIRRRSDRYPGAVNIEPAWTVVAATDPRRIERDPDRKTKPGTGERDHRRGLALIAASGTG